MAKKFIGDETILHRILEELFLECEHGDEEHRQWLRDKFIDFADRKQNESKARRQELMITRAKIQGDK